MLVQLDGLLPPIQNADKIREQFWLAHQYRNRLIAMARKERTELRALELATFGELRKLQAAADAAKTAYRDARDEMKKDRARKRSKQGAVSLLLERSKVAKLDRNKAIEALKQARKDLDRASAQKSAQEIRERYKVRRKAAAAESGLPWGTTQLVDMAMDASLHITLPSGKRISKPLWKNGTEPNDPEFIPWKREGSIGVQIQEETIGRDDGSDVPAWLTDDDSGPVAFAIPSGTKPSKVEGNGPTMRHVKFRGPSDRKMRECWIRVSDIQHGLLGSEVMACDDTRLRIGPLSDHPKWTEERRAKRAARLAEVKLRTRRDGTTEMRAGELPCGTKPGKWHGLNYRTLYMRIGSNPDRSPIWGVWPMSLHRPLPAGCRVVRAAVHCRRRGPAEVWTVTMTLQTLPVIARHGHGAVGLDIGWRTIGDLTEVTPEMKRRGLRVAAWWGDDGQSGELRLSPGDLESICRSNELRSTRDKSLNSLRDRIASWMAESGTTVPAWLIKETEHMSKWRSAGRVYGLMYGHVQHDDGPRKDPDRKPIRMGKKSLKQRAAGWIEQRFDGDQAMVDEILAWLKHDKHLWSYEAEQRQQGLARRRDIYRKFALWLATHYETLCLEDFDLRGVAALPEDESVESENKTARKNRPIAGVSELRTICIQAFLARRGEARKVPAEWTTQTDPVANVLDRFDPAPQIEHTYQPSGETWDQDLAAAKNILRLGFECDDEGNLPGTDRKVEIIRTSDERRTGKWQKMKNKKAQATDEESDDPASDDDDDDGKNNAAE